VYKENSLLYILFDQITYAMKRYPLAFFLLLGFFPLISKAQLCNGTLGAPIFIETFGAGTSAGAALPAGTTTYTYTSGWPTDGQYTIANTSNPPPTNTHWITGTDHTGNANGYMFVVNASQAPGEFFRHTVSGLCANTTYVFSAWIANVNNKAAAGFCQQNDPPYVYPNVLFKVENPATSKIDSVSTGNIQPADSTLTWHQLGFTFSTGAGQTTVDLVMVNNGPGGCGNDLVIDDISFRPCGPTTSIAAVPAKNYYCNGDTLLLDATIGTGYNNPVYQWQFSNDGGTTWQDIPGATLQDLLLKPITKNQAGKYRLILAEKGNITLSKCRIITESIDINVKEGPATTAIATPTAVCLGDSSVLVASGANSYIWSNGNLTATTQVTPTATSTYTVTGTDSATGCTSKITVNVTVNTPPDSPVVAKPDSICAGNSATLIATSPGGTYKWYETPTGGTPLFTGDTFVTPILNAGKTYYVEVVSVHSCTSSKRTPVIVYMNAGPDLPTVAGSDTICAGDSTLLTAIAPGGVYKWYDVATGGSPLFTGNNFHTPVLYNNKTYYVEVISADNCLSTSRTPVTVTMAVVKAEFIADPLTGESPLTVHFTNLSTGGNSYYWDLGNNTSSTSKNTSATYHNKGEQSSSYEVILIITHALGCKDTATLTIKADPFSELIIPNIFTPNGDGINDLFTLESSGLGFLKAELYNRWGLKLYDWETIHGGWDGRTPTGMEVPSGTYFYIIRAKGISGKEYLFKGELTLLR
jgi:gliding motility-associated-like protein